jgi:hypothetical protein
MPMGPAGKNPIAAPLYDVSAVKVKPERGQRWRIFWNRPVVSQPYDQSAVIWSRFTMSTQPNPEKPYDANLGKSTMAKKFATPGRHGARTSKIRPGQN